MDIVGRGCCQPVALDLGLKVELSLVSEVRVVVGGRDSVMVGRGRLYNNLWVVVIVEAVG